MDSREQAIAVARNRLMAARRVVCTGNPNRPGTLASGFQKIFPDAIFLCRSTGWDLGAIGKLELEKLREIFAACNTFLNCSYVDKNVQCDLLEICHASTKYCDVINVGSTHEYDGLGDEDYRIAKTNLRNKSLVLNSFRFRTCHFILGGIKNDSSESKADWLEVDMICQEMIHIWTRPYWCPITSMDQNKQPW